MDKLQVASTDNLGRVKFQPAALHYAYDLEVIRVSDLQSRSSKHGFQRNYLYECPLIILVTEGECRQWIDFEPVDCHRGSFLSVKVGQVHSLGNHNGWNGYMLLLRPDTLIQIDHIPSLSALPTICSLNTKENISVEINLKQMLEDSLRPYSELSSKLLMFQLYVLLARINLIGQKDISTPNKSERHFLYFQQLLDQHFKEWHSPVKYAKKMACSEKTLSRICLNSTGQSTKSLITRRLILESKRLLHYSELNVTEISDLLGFNETTYFCKFFKRETKMSPMAFRNHRG
ncbi:helix-turn-helix domain-containing protein [Acinetobacter pittii]|uniref:helix-turn-helix domain-containing protein n=1 Tax=Acinetobacter pittii TaxID=48296 RepID=UPI00194E6852|nr:helix-turn-helix transcriptional regulator [Acinetobacter pittii]QRQ11556.1 helix-turn-helix domain-containing protein [Acinetobacter pittii]